MKNSTTPPFFMTPGERKTIGETLLISPRSARTYDIICESVYKKNGQDFPERPISLWDIPIPWGEKLDIVEKMRLESKNMTSSAEFLMRSTFYDLDDFSIRDFIIGAERNNSKWEEKNK